MTIMDILADFGWPRQMLMGEMQYFEGKNILVIFEMVAVELNGRDHYMKLCLN